MITEEIAGYTLNGTEQFCVECIHRWVKLMLLNEGYWQHGDQSTEGLLNVLAWLLDIDRDYVESDNFPVPFSHAQAEGDLLDAFASVEATPRCAGKACGNDFLGEF